LVFHQDFNKKQNLFADKFAWTNPPAINTGRNTLVFVGRKVKIPFSGSKDVWTKKKGARAPPGYSTINFPYPTRKTRTEQIALDFKLFAQPGANPFLKFFFR
jgi:hypothetical protein